MVGYYLETHERYQQTKVDRDIYVVRLSNLSYTIGTGSSTLSLVIGKNLDFDFIVGEYSKTSAGNPFVLYDISETTDAYGNTMKAGVECVLHKLTSSTRDVSIATLTFFSTCRLLGGTDIEIVLASTSIRQLNPLLD